MGLHIFLVDQNGKDVSNDFGFVEPAKSGRYSFVHEFFLIDADFDGKYYKLESDSIRLGKEFVNETFGADTKLKLNKLLDLLTTNLGLRVGLEF